MHQILVALLFRDVSDGHDILILSVSVFSHQGWEPMNDMGGNKDFLSKHKGWYLNNVVKKSSKASMEEYRKFAREAERKGKGT